MYVTKNNREQSAKKFALGSSRVGTLSHLTNIASKMVTQNQQWVRPDRSYENGTRFSLIGLQELGDFLLSCMLNIHD